MDNKSKSLTEIHIAVLLFGLAGLFGKFIQLPPVIITFGRVAFAAIALSVILLVRRQKVTPESKIDLFYLFLSGIVLSVHWVTFFKSIQVSNIATALITYSTFPVFTAFIEPYFFHERFKIKNLIPALIAFIGISMVIPKYDPGNNLTQGAFWGIISGITFAFLQTFNRKFVRKYSSLVITFYQAGTASLVLSPFFFLYNADFSGNTIFMLILLGVVFTALAHTLFINGLHNIKAFSAGIISTLEPVYGIIAAFVLLKEMPAIRVISGGIIILCTSLYITLTSKT